MTEDPQSAISRALFSLATGLEVAEGQQTLEAVGRAKMASVLFDEVIIESGLHVVEMTSTVPAMIRRQDAAKISAALLEHSRTVERGTKVGIAIRHVDDQVELYVGTNLPRFKDARYFERDVAFRYVSEYHTGVLDELAKLKADWVNVINIKRDGAKHDSVTHCPLAILSPDGLGNDPFEVLHLDAEEARELSDLLRTEETTPQPTDPDAPLTTAPREWMFAEDLSEAVQIGRELDAVPAISTAFERVALERGVSISLPGTESLGFMVPNFSLLPWEAIAQFRDHPGAVEARGRLREFESAAAASEPRGSAELVRATGCAVTQGLLGVAKDLAPSLPDTLRGPILSTTVGLVPIVGQYASLAVSMGDLIATLRHHEAYEGSWVAAILELRDSSLESLMDF